MKLSTKFKKKVDEKIESMLWNTKRISFSLGFLILMFLLALWMSTSMSGMTNVLGLWLSKAIFISSGIIHAHISRRLMWPYINFNTEKNWGNNAMIIAWYVVIIWGWARGG